MEIRNTEELAKIVNKVFAEYDKAALENNKKDTTVKTDKTDADKIKPEKKNVMTGVKPERKTITISYSGDGDDAAIIIPAVVEDGDGFGIINAMSVALGKFVAKDLGYNENDVILEVRDSLIRFITGSLSDTFFDAIKTILKL